MSWLYPGSTNCQGRKPSAEWLHWSDPAVVVLLEAGILSGLGGELLQQGIIEDFHRLYLLMANWRGIPGLPLSEHTPPLPEGFAGRWLFDRGRPAPL